jgi:hypothetical protein
MPVLYTNIAAHRIAGIPASKQSWSGDCIEDNVQHTGGSKENACEYGHRERGRFIIEDHPTDGGVWHNL